MGLRHDHSTDKFESIKHLRSMIVNPHITVATIVPIRNKYIIIEERINQEIVYNQPAGHVEEDEDFVDAATRETLEETGWLVEVKSLVGIYRLRVPQFNFIRFLFYARPIEQKHSRPVDSNILYVHYLDLDDLKHAKVKMRSALVERGIIDYERGRSIPLDHIDFIREC